MHVTVLNNIKENKVFDLIDFQNHISLIKILSVVTNVVTNRRTLISAGTNLYQRETYPHKEKTRKKYNMHE